MEKLVFVVDRDPTLTLDTFSAIMREDLVKDLRKLGASAIVTHIRDLDDEVLAVNPARIGGRWDTVSGAFSLWVDSLDVWQQMDAALKRACQSTAAYLYTESVVQKDERAWEKGERRPGVCQFNLAQRPSNVSLADFYREWMEVHTPFSFRLHPNRKSYVRNALARVLTPGATPWDIFVLEHFDPLEDFTTQERYAGSPALWDEAMRHLPAFVDLNTFISGPMSEFHFD